MLNIDTDVAGRNDKWIMPSFTFQFSVENIMSSPYFRLKDFYVQIRLCQQKSQNQIYGIGSKMKLIIHFISK